MLKRVDSLNYAVPTEGQPESARLLERDGHFVLRNGLAPDSVGSLREELLRLYAETPADMRPSATSPEIGAMYRYDVFNRSPLSQHTIADRAILDVVEPLLGEDCHVIACTAWNNPPGESLTPHGIQWHVDGGPHVPRAPGTDWPDNIPYPVFAISSHIYLSDVGEADGPTACIPGSHTSGCVPPLDAQMDDALSYRGKSAVRHIVHAGDIDFRVSDVWHRRWPPTTESRGRLFLQTTYARRDIAQRLLDSHTHHHATAEALQRCRNARERRLLGEHPAAFYDA